MGLSVTVRRLVAACRRSSGATPFQDLSLGALLLFCALLFPFILSYHRDPIPSFYQEWLAIFLALAAAILVAAKYRDECFELPFAAWIPLALAPSVMIHLVAGNELIVHGPPLHLMYIASAVLLMTIGRKLGSAPEAVPLADVMAAALVTGTLLSCVASWHWRFQTGVFDALPWASDMGWIGQRNQNALHLWLGVLGISHFVLNRKVSWFYFLACLGILTEAAAYTESRSVYLYAACGLALGVWAAVKSSSLDARKRLLLIGCLPAILLGAIQVTQLLPDRDSGKDSSVNSGAIHRYAPAAVGQDARLGLWLTAAQVTLARPWLGAGPGSYIRESWLLSDKLPSTVPTTIPSTHAHNLFLQVSAELGAPTTLALAGLIAAWLVLALRQADWQRNWLHVAIPVAIFAHNQVEYSLWYLYFLVPTALAMGAATTRHAARRLPLLATRLMLLVALCGFGIAVRLGDDYKTVEAAIAHARSGHGDVSRLLAAAKHPVFGAWASTEIAGRFWPTGIASQTQDEHASQAQFVAPLKKAALLRYADSLARSGKPAAAATELRIARRVFGDE